MSTLLYITAHPFEASKSFSLAAGEAFLQAYRVTHPADKVIILDLFKVEIPLLDADVFHGREKMQEGMALKQLPAAEQAQITRMSDLVEQFIAADKYVFVTPMWNFSYPPVMKAYLDTLAVPGKTFAYTSSGPQGLLAAKKALHIQASGGVYSEGPAAQMNLGHQHLSTILQFFGISQVEALFIEGHNQFPDRAQAIKDTALSRAEIIATDF
ncbi:FMN-dependent NADH-azoreductase [Paenibacillus sp. LMG 31460]|uniref:FMN dependent NADH:quinone oxidoreductase n=1 Tax=Paenibacillus germinis TaxID=2654979 RepID=A0ABX1ZB43_9BACL|nr:FMN-dependent NADH-azoreductase [Paenibacillus germinis]NOU90327.1 FMN-dependent NADH-azoreductase [Paenibacillus germinis]